MGSGPITRSAFLLPAFGLSGSLSPAALSVFSCPRLGLHPRPRAGQAPPAVISAPSSHLPACPPARGCGSVGRPRLLNCRAPQVPDPTLTARGGGGGRGEASSQHPQVELICLLECISSCSIQCLRC